MKARAKINLALDVLGKRPDGYHEIRTIMQSLELCDEVSVREIGDGIEIQSSSRSLPLDGTNTAHKAARILLDRYLPGKGVGINIVKNIPIAAGLAGGSADAASVLKGMNRLFGLGLSVKELMEAGRNVGADVPFCIRGGTALAEGIGEKITPLAALPETHVLLVCPEIAVSTAGVYGRLNLDKITVRPDINGLIRLIESGERVGLGAGMVNVLETVTAEATETIGEIKNRLIESGAFAGIMSGSGPTVFGLFTEKSKAIEARQAIEARHAIAAQSTSGTDTGIKCFLTKTYNEECS